MLLGLLSVLVATATSCSSREIDELVADAFDSPSILETYIELLRIDRAHPGVPEVEVKLAEILVQSGRIDEAGVYLESAREGLRSRTKTETKIGVYRLLALWAYNMDELDRSVEYATKAIDLIAEREGEHDDTGDLQAMYGLRARASAALGDHGAAIDDFGRAEASSESILPKVVLSSYAESLVDQGDWDAAIRIVALENKTYGYDLTGIINEIWLHEQTGAIAPAVLGVGLQFEFMRPQHEISPDEMVDRLQSAGIALDDDSARIVELLSAFSAEEWDAVRGVSSPVSVRTHPFMRYIKAIAEMQQELAPATLSDYAEIEPWFRNMQGYYYHLWAAIRDSGSQYSLAIVGDAMERTILLAPDSARASETRRELCAFMGIDPGYAESLLLRAEVDTLIQRSLQTGSGTSLERVVELLDLPDNRYTTYAVVALTSVSGNSRMREALEAHASVSSGRRADRLRGILRS